MSCQEMTSKNFFPKSAGDSWEISGEPRCHNRIWGKGYIHAMYKHQKKTGYASSALLKVWIIDKISPDGAEQWLEQLLSGAHNGTSVRPLYEEASQMEKRRDFYMSFHDHPVDMLGGTGYEKTKRIEDPVSGGLIRYTYYHYCPVIS